MIDDGWFVTWESGPDAGASWVLRGGPHLVGRAPQATVRTTDPSLEPFHAHLSLESGEPIVRQLSGRLPIRHERPDGQGRWRVGIGQSVLCISAATDPAPVPALAADRPRTIVRTPRQVPVWNPSVIRLEREPAAPQRSGGSLAPALVALAVTVGLAVVVRQPMFAMFAAVGTVAALSHWTVGRLGHRRAMRNHRRQCATSRSELAAALAAQRDAFIHHVHRAVPTLPSACAALTSGSGLWQRRQGDGDEWTVSLGIGSIRWTPSVDGDDSAESSNPQGVDDVPVATDLGPGARLAISGPHAMPLVNALVVQLAACTGPADWQLVVVTDEPSRWQWLPLLPHVRDETGQPLVLDDAALLDALRDGRLAARHTVVITDQPAGLAMRTSPLRRLEATHTSLAVIVVHDGPPPAICRSSVVITADARARFVADLGRDHEPVTLRVAAAPTSSAERWAASISDCRDPEDERTCGADIPLRVSIEDVLERAGVDPHDVGSIVSRWTLAGPDPAPCTPIGCAADGVVDIDLVRDGPHALLAGTTGSGKSELMRSLVLGLSCSVGPQHLTFVLVDYKGGAAFDELRELPHVVGTVTDLDDQLAERALRSLRAELATREQVLREHGVADLGALRARTGAPVMPRVLVVVDEFAALATEQAEFLHALVGIAQRGRSLGVHLLLGTQRPSGVISDDIRANTNLRIALRLHDVADAVDVVGDAAPASLPRAVPGRAIMRLGPDELVTFQTAHAGNVPAVVDAVCAAAESMGLAQPRPVWCAPLPTRFTRADVAERLPGTELDPHVIGLVDRPDEQAQGLWRWTPEDGSAVVVGSPGAGVTSTLVGLATSALSVVRPGDRFTAGSDSGAVFVIDATNDDAWDAVSPHPRCAGVVRLHERERLWRLLRRVADSSGPACLVIDGLGQLRHDLDAVERIAEVELLDRIIGSGDVTLMIGADRVGSVPASVTARCAVRVVLHLHDPHDGLAFGVPAALAPPAVAGRAAVDGSAIQVVMPEPLPAGRRRPGRVASLDTLPADVGTTELPDPVHTDIGWRVAVGLGFDALRPATIEVGDGDHLLVVGPSRSGRSTAVHHLAEQWVASDAANELIVVATRRSPLSGARGDLHPRLDDALDAVSDALASQRRVMLAIDDAELVDDPSGRLSAMVAGRTSRLLVVAAGRPDALRQSYGHWTAAVRRSRLGLVLSGGSDLDGDLLGVMLPRRTVIAPRPGLAHLVDGGRLELVQLAHPAPQTQRRAQVS
ncbi:MAG: FtsK/SpoIIIE domain-containing protein [Ilumatobacteraceae bacterium]